MQEEKEDENGDEMVGWHHRLNGHEFEMMKDREAWRAAVHGLQRVGHDLAAELNVYWNAFFKRFIYFIG